MLIPTRKSLSAAALCLLGISCVQAQNSPPPLPEGAEWTETASGLRYTVINPGKGEPVAKPGDSVVAHYTGWLKDNGKKFDSSYDRGQPFSFTCGRGVIAGWSEGVQLMPVGAKYRFEIPAKLGYGERGSGGAIPPGATLLFDIELVDVPKPHPFVPAKEGAAKELSEGITMEIVKAGAGDTMPADGIPSMHFSIYQADGKLIHSTKMRGELVKAPLEAFVFGVLKKAPPAMRKGDLCRLVASKAAGLGDRSPPGVEETVWFIELVDYTSPLPLPAFETPADGDLQKSDSGLKWKVLGEGAGESPKRSDMVTVHYVGRLMDGTIFDSSYSRGEPASFSLGGVIRGWTEGVAMMKPGEKRVFVIPSDLAYGDRGSPPTIPGGATLVFYIELIKIGG